MRKFNAEQHPVLDAARAEQAFRFQVIGDVARRQVLLPARARCYREPILVTNENRYTLPARNAVIRTHERGPPPRRFAHCPDPREFAWVLIRCADAPLTRAADPAPQSARLLHCSLALLTYGQVWPLERGLHETTAGSSVLG
jgi:hypothetical protein